MAWREIKGKEGLRNAARSGWVEEAKFVREMKKRWADKRQKADENVCLRSIENFKKGEVSNKVKCCRELRSNRYWKNAYQIEWYVVNLAWAVLAVQWSESQVGVGWGNRQHRLLSHMEVVEVVLCRGVLLFWIYLFKGKSLNLFQCHWEESRLREKAKCRNEKGQFIQ